MFAANRREIWAEFLGTFVLMVFGLGVNAQVTLGSSTAELSGGTEIAQFAHGEWLSINIGWGLAVIMGIYVAGGVTGAHINPAVTIALAARKRFPKNKIAPYILAQLAGAFVASVIVFVVYYEAINFKELDTTTPSIADTGWNRYSMDTAGIYSTYPRTFAKEGDLDAKGEVRAEDEQVSLLGGLVDQIIGTALLLLCILAITDTRNNAAKSNLGPVVVGMVVLLIGMTFGSNAGYAINPARDFSPRLFTFFAGWGPDVFAVHGGLWWLVPIVGPCLGGVLGALAYDMLITKFHPPEDEPALEGSKNE